MKPSQLGYWLAVAMFGKRNAIKPAPTPDPKGDFDIQVAIKEEAEAQQAYYIGVARTKLRKQNVTCLAGLSKRLGVYHLAANSLAGHANHTNEQIKHALIDAITSVDDYVAALADDADNDYDFPCRP